MDIGEIQSDFIKQSNEVLVKTPKVIYIDMAILKAYFLGAIISLVKDKEMYDYIISNIDKYNKRLVDDIALIYPELPIKQDAVIARLHDIEHAECFQYTSPSTTYEQKFFNYLILNNNKAAASGNKEPIKLIINTYPITLPDIRAAQIAVWFIKNMGYTTCVISKHINDLHEKTVLSIDDWFIYQPSMFMENPICITKLQNNAFVSKNISAMKLLKDSQPYKVHKTEADILSDLTITESYLNFMCNFSFLTDVHVLPK